MPDSLPVDSAISASAPGVQFVDAHTSATAIPIESIHELPNALMILRNGWLRNDHKVYETIEYFEPVFFSVLIATVVCVIVRIGTRHMTMIPGRLQNVIEMVVEGFDNMFEGIFGDRKHSRRHLPFLGSLFLFIWFNNMMGLVPLGMAPTSLFETTLALGAFTFLYVQFWALRMNGIRGYVFHLMGSPKGAVMWVMSPLFLFLHVLGEIIKPISLSLRLRGNIMGEDILLYVVAFLGMSLILWGFPLQLPFLFLSLLLGTIQALVFTLLAAVYIVLFIPHEHGEH